MKVMLANLEPSYKDKIIFSELVVDQDSNALDQAKMHGVNAVPTLLLVTGDEEHARLVGDVSREKVVNVIEGYLQSNLLPQ